MVKGISRQVIVVHSPDPELFEQAIFILKDGARTRRGVTDEQLMKEAKRLIATSGQKRRKTSRYPGPVWACGGALLTAAAWLVSSIL